MARTMPSDDELAHVEGCLGEDLDAVLVFTLLRANSYLGLNIDAGLREQRLKTSQFNTLLLLRSAGSKGMLMSEIGERLVVAKSNVTGLIDRLEAQGLVARGDHEDRRAIIVRLTKAGAELLNAALPRHSELMGELTRCLSRSEKETLVRLLTKLRRELRQLRERKQL